MVAAEMHPSEKPSGRYDHMALLVHINNESYLVDVGNGKYFGDPIPVSEASVTQGEDTSYKIMTFDPEHLGLFLQDAEDEWQVRYIFKKEPKKRDDFLAACHYTETSPESIFTQSRIITLLTSEGRITLSEREGNSIVWTQTGKGQNGE